MKMNEQKKLIKVNKELATKVLEVVDKGLCVNEDDGTFDKDGKPVPGHMCVEAAVNFAMGEEHGDDPPCVGMDVRSLKIALNDSRQWKNNKSRARGLRRIAVAQLGSNKINQKVFSKLFCAELFDHFYIKPMVGLSIEKMREKLMDKDKMEELSNMTEALIKNDYPDIEGAIRSVGDLLYSEKDLIAIANMAEKVLVQMKTAGSKFLSLCDVKGGDHARIK